MRKITLFFIGAYALFSLLGCESESKKTTIYTEGDLILDVVKEPYKTIILYKGESEIFRYHEEQISDTAKNCFAIDEYSQDNDELSSSKKYFLWQDGDILLLRFFNINEDATKRRDKYFFVNTKTKEVLISFIGKRLFLNEEQNCFITRNIERVSGVESLSLPDKKVFINALTFGIAVSDYNNDNVFDQIDAKISLIKNRKLTSEQKQYIENNFNAEKCLLKLPNDKDFNLDVCTDFCDIIQRKCNCNQEKAVYLLSQLDANNDLKISWGDDVNIDGYIDANDFIAERKLYQYFALRYNSTFNQKNIIYSDILFGLNVFYGSYGSHIKRVDSRDMNFDKMSYSQSNKNIETSDYKVETQYPSHSLTGTLLGSGLGSFLGFMTGGPVGLIVGGLSGGGAGNGTGVLVNRDRKVSYKETITEYFRYEQEKDGVINIAMFTAQNGYKVFILDASGSITEETTRIIINKYENKELKTSSRKEICKNWTIVADQRTTGRISVYDPTRKIQCNFKDQKFEKVFSKLIDDQSVNEELVKSLIQPFENSKDEILNFLWQLEQIAQGIQTFDKGETFYNQNSIINAKLLN